MTNSQLILLRNITSAIARLQQPAVTNFLCKSTFTLVALLFSQMVLAATCKYEIVNEWNTGFQAKVSIMNESESPLNNWSVSWAWVAGSTFANGWEAAFDCANSACTATGPAWAPNISANQTFEFGFIGNKGVIDVPADSSIVINGDVCNTSGGTPTTPTPKPPTQNNVVSFLPAILDILFEEDESSLAAWALDASQSTIKFVSVKNSHTAETHKFAQDTNGVNPLDGSIDSEGNAILAIDLNGVETGIDIRNERMRNFVFETQLLPTAYIAVKLDPETLSAMNVGATEMQSITGKLSLHGVSQDIVAEVIVAKTSETSLMVSTVKPIIIDSKDFDFASGIDVLKGIASLAAIGEVVPVYFSLHYEANTGLALSLPNQPEAPTNLSAQYNATSANASLTWQDKSVNESGFIIRRKTADGLWSTVKNVLSNVTTYNETLVDIGNYDYKTIALNGSMPSAPSNTVRVIATDVPDPGSVVEGERIYLQQCNACHGPTGAGVGSFPSLTTPRDLDELAAYITDSMPLGNAGDCDEQCADDVVSYIQTFWIDDPDPGETACTVDGPINYGARQLKILTRSEYQRSVEDLLGVDFDAAAGLSEDNKIGLFANNTHTSIVSSSYSNYLIVAEEIAQWSADRNFSPALSCNAMDQSCVDTFLNDFAPRVFRRPLSTEELQTYNAMADGTLTEDDISEGIAMAIEAMLSSPQFLYRHELGEPNPNNPLLDSDAFELTSHEMATFLAYTFTGSTPDHILLEAANNDLLRTDSEILQQAIRLTGAATAQEIMGDFVASWLGTDDLDIAAKDESVWPDFDALVPHMKNEIRANFANVMLDRSESFSSLYDADFCYINQTLAQHYGIAGVFGNDLRRIETADRGGILANGAFMARWGEAVETSPIIRSVRVRRRMLCQDELPNPPAGTFEAREARLAELSDILSEPTTTNRYKNHLLTEGEPCSSCHLEYINPLGFGMEDFDTVGKLRFNDLNGNSIDATGQLFAPTDYNDTSEVEAFTGATGLAQVMSSLATAQSCLSKQMFRYVTGVGHNNIDISNPEAPDLADDEKDGYACEIENLTNAMMDESPRAMLEHFSTLDAIRYRKAWPRQ